MLTNYLRDEREISHSREWDLTGDLTQEQLYERAQTAIFRRTHENSGDLKRTLEISRDLQGNVLSADEIDSFVQCEPSK